MTPRCQVLLVWPGSRGMTRGNFGIPGLVALGSYVERHGSADVHLRDLGGEQLFGGVDLERLFTGQDARADRDATAARGYDVIGFSVYSSYDYLTCLALAELARRVAPRAVIVAGGYHPSACPEDFQFEGSPFDVAVIGEGERPLVRVVESVRGGAPLREVTLGPDPIAQLEHLPPSDWTLLERYRSIAPRMATQAQVYLARGCPFGCSFCMERAKREVGWRPLSVERAVDELTRLHRFLDLRGWSLFLVGPLFGLDKRWRQEMLEALARRELPTQANWLLTRIDRVDPDDLPLFARANCGLGLGLESGSPRQLSIMGKTSQPERYLERMLGIAEEARRLGVPWGVNVVVGHPGETRATLAETRDYLERLLLAGPGSTGFLSVDPFRLYPGSPVATDWTQWEQDWGARLHRPRWWHDGDQEFLSEWVDPSSELDYVTCSTLRHQLLAPLLNRVEERFVYRGPGRDYYVRSIREQLAVTDVATRFHYRERYYAWQRYLGRGSGAARALLADEPLAEAARMLRLGALPEVAARLRLDGTSPVLRALETVPRERFLPLDQLVAAVQDVPPESDTEQPTVPALHTYAQKLVALGASAGDAVLVLDPQEGYVVGLLAEVVGTRGRVVALTVSEPDAASLRERLRDWPQVTVVVADPARPESASLEPTAFDRVLTRHETPRSPDPPGCGAGDGAGAGDGDGSAASTGEEFGSGP